MGKLLDDKKKDFVFKASAILILIAACVYLFNPLVASFIMIIGVVGFTITTFLTPYPGKSLRGKRLYNIKIFGIIFMVMSTYLMYVRRNEWVVLMLIAAFLTLYSAILLPKVYQQELDKDKK
ncbi:MAG: hypothetical protein E6772_00400 [Dysgonomonas sp.]|nr:hypothetical protein [Dysgonomonas sp.]